MKVEEQKRSAETMRKVWYKTDGLEQVEAGVNDERYDSLDRVLEEHEDQEGSLITVLHHAQKIFGHLPREVQIYIAERLGIPFAEVYGVVSFYSLFTVKPRGEFTIEVCMGTACYVKGARKVLDKLQETLGIEPGETTKDGKFTIETTRCLGACSLAPIIKIGDDVHGNIKAEEIPELLKKYQHPEYSMQYHGREERI